jgi:hypothetical protein
MSVSGITIKSVACSDCSGSAVAQSTHYISMGFHDLAG